MEIILGAVVSVLIQLIKKYFDTSSWQSWGIAIVVSVAVAIIYTGLIKTGFWDSFLQILTVAGAVYSYIISMMPKAVSKSE